eukprot:TRINITY_DN12976_c0_g1_i1.p1 TRINITY_DN12976_c0_g1~~TRINITY_DN12976_c0_g1_i1.p1  ORF type:complete len:283 (-),score=84.68 TRINITY_DN12976_c0_g1_i1:26-874(-)
MALSTLAAPAFCLGSPLLPVSPQHSLPSLQPARSARRLKVSMALEEGTQLGIVVAAAGSSLSLLLGARLFSYFRLQYVTAAMLGRNVPKGGARLLDLNVKAGRSLYYLPDDADVVLALSPTDSLQLLKQQAINAGIRLEAVAFDSAAASSSPRISLPADNVDAVVSVGGLLRTTAGDSSLPFTPASLLKEAARILKPGMPLIFIEKSSKGIFQGRSAVDLDILTVLKSLDEFDTVQYDTILKFAADPHVVGVAIKASSSPRSNPSDLGGVAKALQEKRKRRR